MFDDTYSLYYVISAISHKINYTMIIVGPKFGWSIEIVWNDHFSWIHWQQDWAGVPIEMDTGEVSWEARIKQPGEANPRLVQIGGWGWVGHISKNMVSICEYTVYVCSVCYMYLYVVICIYMYLYVFICIYMYLYVFICIYMYLYVFICIYMYLYVFICIYMYLYVDVMYHYVFVVLVFFYFI